MARRYTTHWKEILKVKKKRLSYNCIFDYLSCIIYIMVGYKRKRPAKSKPGVFLI
ncbi:hypothetical protein [Spirosoma arboris]|uniref:hypothetical protein n=1 Tax=Spirosoma arboris TaxID=2682092 RepID=UPI0037449535